MRRQKWSDNDALGCMQGFTPPSCQQGSGFGSVHILGKFPIQIDQMYVWQKSIEGQGVVRSRCWFRHNFFYIYCFSFSLNWIQIHPKLTALLEQHDSGGLHDGASCSLPTGDRWSSRPQVTVPRRLSGESHCRQISTLVSPCDPHSLFWCVKRGWIWCFSVYRISCVRISITYALHMEPGGNLNTVLIIKYLSLIWHSVAQA